MFCDFRVYNMLSVSDIAQLDKQDNSIFFNYKVSPVYRNAFDTDLGFFFKAFLWCNSKPTLQCIITLNNKIHFFFGFWPLLCFFFNGFHFNFVFKPV